MSVCFCRTDHKFFSILDDSTSQKYQKHIVKCKCFIYIWSVHFFFQMFWVRSLAIDARIEFIAWDSTEGTLVSHVLFLALDLYLVDG